MKGLITSDVHVQYSGMFALPTSQGITTRSEIAFAFLEWLLEKVQEYQIKYVCIAGDLFTFKTGIQTPLYNKTFDYIKRLCKLCGVVTIPGNHDRFQSTGIHCLHALREIKDFYVLEEGEANNIFITDPTGDTVRIWGVPSGTKFPEKLHAQNVMSVRNILLMHENIVGAQYPTGWEATGGVEPVWLRKYLDEYQVDLCFCGDIHKPQIIQDKIVVTGAPYQMDFGDEYDPRGIWIYDSEENCVDFLDYDKGPRFGTINDNTLKDYLNGTLGFDFVRFRLTKRDNLELLHDACPDATNHYVEPAATSGDAAINLPDLTDYTGMVSGFVRARMQADEDLVDIGEDVLIKMGLEYLEQVRGAIT